MDQKKINLMLEQATNFLSSYLSFFIRFITTKQTENIRYKNTLGIEFDVFMLNFLHSCLGSLIYKVYKEGNLLDKNGKPMSLNELVDTNLGGVVSVVGEIASRHTTVNTEVIH